MKKPLRHILILCTIFSTVMLCGNASAVLNEITYNLTSYALFGEEQIPSGELYKAANGEDVPTSIFYIDAAGGYSNFLSVSKIAEILDADVKWDGRTKMVDFGTADTPQADTVNLPFTEMEYSGDFESEDNIKEILKDALFQSESTFNQVFYCPPRFGEYILIKVANEGTQPVSFFVFRDKTIGNQQPFPTDIIQPGDTKYRLFSVDDGASELTCNLGMTVAPLKGKDFAALNIRVEVTQHDGNGASMTQRNMKASTVDDFDGLTMEVVKAAPAKLSVNIKNTSKRSFSYDNSYVIETFRNGQWLEVEQSGAVNAVTPVAYEIRAGAEKSFDVSIVPQYEALSAGMYRVKKGISEIGSQQICCYLVAEFEI